MGPACHPNASPHTQEEIAYGKRMRASLPGPTPRLGHALRRRMAVSVMQRCLTVLWSVLTIVLAVTGAQA
jgi:hypothetical protein